MLVLLSPAKKLDYDTPLPVKVHSQPRFMGRAAALMNLLKTKSVEEIAALMSLSDPLAQLNAQRYAEWVPVSTSENARPAVFAFNGDVYEGLQASQLSTTDLMWAQEHVVILSGLYGALRPLDLIQPYRLEMGTSLVTPQGQNLYAFWGSDIAAYLQERLVSASAPLPQQTAPLPILLNLASEEYFKVVAPHPISVRTVQCVFQDWKSGAWKIVSFYAKRARGLMARYIIEHQCVTLDALQNFRRAGYVYAPSASTADKLVFRRKA